MAGTELQTKVDDRRPIKKSRLEAAPGNDRRLKCVGQWAIQEANDPASNAGKTNKMSAIGACLGAQAISDSQAVEEAFERWWASDEAQGQLSYVDREAARIGWMAGWRAVAGREAQ